MAILFRTLLILSALSDVVLAQSSTSPVSLSSPMRPRLLSPVLGLILPEKRHLWDTQPRVVGRWRLEKENPAVLVSEPVQPIVCRLNASIPRKWLPWVRRGIENWNPVFEAVGFRRAIHVIVDSSSPAISSSPLVQPATLSERLGCLVGWGGELKWGSTSSAVTLVQPDSATGEIRQCRIDILGVADHWRRSFFWVIGATHPQLLTNTDSAPGRLLQALTEHEMGHCLGLSHYYREGRYPTDSLRSAGFVHRMSHVPSVMSYQFFNEVAQFEDQIPFDDMVMKIGPHDRWLIKLLYQPIPNASTPEAELPTLATWRVAQDTALYVRAMNPTYQVTSLGNDLLTREAYKIQHLAAILLLLSDVGHWNSSIMEYGVGPVDSFPSKLIGNWTSSLMLMTKVVGGYAAQHPYPRTAQEEVMRSYDSTAQVRAVREVFGRLFYGRDPFVRAIVQPTPSDTSLLLFSHVPSPWRTSEWRQAQIDVSRTLATQLAILAQQRPTLVTALCAEVIQQQRALTSWLPSPSSAPTVDSATVQTRAHMNAILQVFQSITDTSSGVCRANSSMTK